MERTGKELPCGHSRWQSGLSGGMSGSVIVRCLVCGFTFRPNEPSGRAAAAEMLRRHAREARATGARRPGAHGRQRSDGTSRGRERS